jgi:hypothetical protein
MVLTVTGRPLEHSDVAAHPRPTAVCLSLKLDINEGRLQQDGEESDDAALEIES